jgi:hypothetical protein
MSLQFEPASSGRPRSLCEFSAGISGGFGGSDDDDDCNAIAFGGSQLAQRQVQTRTTSEPHAAVPTTSGIRYRTTDPRHAPTPDTADLPRGSSGVQNTRERKHEKQKKEKRKKEKRKKEKKGRKERKRDRKKEKKELSHKKRRRQDDDANSSSWRTTS